ncbi:hypothetical protein [Streptomyces sp. NPDC006997]|uniref:hypothetical protein n=1 Tax=Streptomyces sp. NPDC006997 TaxID=3155356 RepID=UPI0033D33B35
MSRTPRRRTPQDPGRGPAPVDVRLMGDDTAVRHLVAALQQTADCGPATYRPMRDSDGTRAYLSIVVPPDAAREG